MVLETPRTNGGKTLSAELLDARHAGRTADAKIATKNPVKNLLL